MQNIRNALPLSGISIQLHSLYASGLYRRNFKAIITFLSLCLSVFVFSHLKIFQISALRLPVMSEVRYAARTKRVTSSVTVSQAGPEPDVIKVLSSLWKVGVYIWTLCARAQQM